MRWLSEILWAGVLLLVGVALWSAIIELFRPPRVNLFWEIDRSMDYARPTLYPGDPMVDIRCGGKMVAFHIPEWKAEKLVAWHNAAVLGRLPTKDDMPKRGESDGI